jgi:tetratricopeptide (TPR) repeat protein
MNLRSIVRLVSSLVIFGSACIICTEVAFGVEPHGATMRIPDRSNWSSVSSNDSYVGRLLNEVNSALGNDQYDEAIAKCTRILEQHPVRKIAAFVYKLRSDAYQGKHQKAQALSDAESAVRIDPSSPWGYIARGLRSDDDKLAIRDFNDALRLDPKNPLAYLNRGVSYDRILDFDRAIADYTEAIRHNLASEYAYEYRAYAYEHQRNFRAALADLESAVTRAKRRPPEDYAKALNDLAWLKAACPQSEFRDGKKAVELAIKACELSKWKSPSDIDTLAAAYAECSDFDQAIKYGTQAVNTTDLYPYELQKYKSMEAERRREHLQAFKNRQPVRSDFKRFDQ